MPAYDQVLSDGPSASPVFDRLLQEKNDLVQKALLASGSLGLWALADDQIPPDVREAAARWGLEQTITELWRSAYISGFRKAEELRLRASLDTKEGGGE